MVHCQLITNEMTTGYEIPMNCSMPRSYMSNIYTKSAGWRVEHLPALSPALSSGRRQQRKDGTR